MSSSSESAVDIGSSDEFPEGGRQVDVQGRPLSIFRHEGKLYALDNHCYHAGGPLAMGDIEDIKLKKTGENMACVICPWHKYKISLKTGEGIYFHTDPFGPPGKKPKLKSRGKKQRTHEIYETEDGRVMVTLNLSNEIKFESDYYASEDFQQLMQKKKGGRWSVGNNACCTAAFHRKDEAELVVYQ